MVTVWVDSFVVSKLQKEHFDRLTADGYTLVVSNTAIDIKAFQENIGWLEEQLSSEKIVIHLWVYDLDEMTFKPMYWSSCSQTTAPAKSFEDAVMELPNAAGILDVSDLIFEHGIPFGSWLKEDVNCFEFTISNDMLKLGINVHSNTRSDIYAICQKANRMDIFDTYNEEYVRRIAIQHCCDAILNSDGTITIL